MMMLNLRRGLVPACLTLGAALFALPLLADPPAAPSVQASAPQIIVLQHVVPADVVKLMHWDLPSKLPAGVTQVQALPAQNALAVMATPAGLARMREIVKTLDIAPRQVQITFALAHASDADIDASGISFDLVPLLPPSPQMYRAFASGPAAVRFLQTLTTQKTVTLTQILTTTNNVKASIASGGVELAATPRVNSDNTVTLALAPAFTIGTVKHILSTLRTVRNGDTLVIVLPDADPQTGTGNSLLFVTPTVK